MLAKNQSTTTLKVVWPKDRIWRENDEIKDSKIKYQMHVSKNCIIRYCKKTRTLNDISTLIVPEAAQMLHIRTSKIMF